MKENIEEEKAINNMKMFARVRQDMTIVTAKDMDIVLNLIEKLQEENEEYLNAINISNKEKEDWIKAYQEEKDKQFELLRENQLAKEALKKQCEIADERNQLLKENEELKENNKRLTDEYMIQKHLINADFLSDYILKQKVKDKIEEINKIYDDIPDDEGNFTKAILIKERQVLQELLESEDK